MVYDFLLRVRAEVQRKRGGAEQPQSGPLLFIPFSCSLLGDAQGDPRQMRQLENKKKQLEGKEKVVNKSLLDRICKHDSVQY